MSILSSLYAGISGLATNGNAMSVIGNNIANTNTIGFKSSRTIFSDLLASAISGSGGASQVGRGVGLSTVDNIFSQGTFESTESNTDLAIEGRGFFMLRDPDGTTLNFSRAGAFHFDATGNLINAEGYSVQGYNLDQNGNTIGDLTNIMVNNTTFTPASPTTTVDLSTNLDSTSPYRGDFDITDPVNTSNYAVSIQIYDSMGETHLITNYFARVDPAVDPLAWDVYTTIDGGELDGGTAGDLTQLGTATLNFDNTGALVAPVTVTTAALDWANGADPAQTVDFNLNCTRYASDSVVNSQSQDGYAAGTLTKVEIDNSGIVHGSYSNGEQRAIAQIALASFSNAGGLTKKGNNLFLESTGSGPPIIGTVGSGVGKIFTNSLEQSNVDLAQEFVKMISVQRGFQANSKIITTIDEMMSDLINLKR